MDRLLRDTQCSRAIDGTVLTIEYELTARIKKDLDYFQGSMPEHYAIAWHAYLAGLLEWGIIEVSVHKQLIGLLPAVTDDPSTAILLGCD